MFHWTKLSELLIRICCSFRTSSPANWERTTSDPQRQTPTGAFPRWPHGDRTQKHTYFLHREYFIVWHFSSTQLTDIHITIYYISVFSLLQLSVSLQCQPPLLQSHSAFGLNWSELSDHIRSPGHRSGDADRGESRWSNAGEDACCTSSANHVS